MKLSVSSLCRGWLVTALAVLTLNAVSAADSFEGRIHMDVTSGRKEKVGIDYAMKDGKMRMDPQMDARHGGGGVGIIMNLPGQEMIILMNQGGQKMYMRRPIPQATPQAGQHQGGKMPSPPVKTGRTETIAGYSATEYTTTTEKGEKVEFWLAKGLGPFMSMSGGNPMMGQSQPPAGWETFARDGNAFPMRVVTYDSKGTEIARMEVTKVDKTSLPDSLFSTDGYSEFSIPGFGGGANPFKR